MLTELLTGWITHQRWFAGKGRPIDDLTVESDVELAHGLRHLIISVRQGGAHDRYQLLLGSGAEESARFKPAHIGDGYYDAAYDADLTGVLLQAMAAGRDLGPLRFRHMEGTEIDTSLRSLVLGAEQSNTSLVYGDTYICKLFRRLIAGVNPELEIVTALALRSDSARRAAVRLDRDRPRRRAHHAGDDPGVPVQRQRRLGTGPGERP